AASLRVPQLAGVGEQAGGAPAEGFDPVLDRRGALEVHQEDAASGGNRAQLATESVALPLTSRGVDPGDGALVLAADPNGPVRVGEKPRSDAGLVRADD